jgi:hypothetical protein
MIAELVRGQVKLEDLIQTIADDSTMDGRPAPALRGMPSRLGESLRPARRRSSSAAPTRSETGVHGVLSVAHGILDPR